MSIEQWSVLALLALLPWLAGVARRRRAPAGAGGPGDGIVRAPASRPGRPFPDRSADAIVVRAGRPLASPMGVLPPPLPPPAPLPDEAAAPVRARQAPASRRPDAFERHTRPPTSRGGGVAHWLRPVRNLRRAIIVATILGPPPR